MPQTIALVTLIVRDYDEAIAFYRDSLGFAVLEDSPQEGDKRWVVVAPPRTRGPGLLLAKAATPAQDRQVGDQAPAGSSCFSTRMISIVTMPR